MAETDSGAKGGIFKIFQSTGQKLSPALQTVGGKMATGAGAAGKAATRRAFDAIRDPGFILFILGLLTFFFNEYLGNNVIAILLASIFLFYSAFFIFKGRGLAVTIAFWIWYVFLGGSTDPKLLMYYLAPILLVAMVAHGLFNHLSKKNSFIEGFAGELIGLVPILFFFLDLGLLPLLTKTFSVTLTPLLQNVILFTPWWALLGLFTTEKENVFIGLAKIIGIVYIFSILLLGVTPNAYSQYKSVVPGPEQLLQAKTEIAQQLPQTENPALSNLYCIFSDPTNIQPCVDKRQEDSKLKYICEKQRSLTPGTIAYNDCIKDEQERSKKQISGTEDTTIKEVTKAEFKLSEYLKEPIISYQPDYSYPIQLEISNPNELNLTFNISCYFKKGSKNLSGVPDPQGFLITKKTDSKSITCKANESLNGTYTLVYEANIYNMITASRLTRIFVGNITTKTKQEIDELKSTYVPGKQYLSLAPKEFARINFGFGEPETNPIIESDDRPLLVSTIENVGGGKILKINQYKINLAMDGITPLKANCLEGSGENIKIPESGFLQNIPLTSCFLYIPPELLNTENFLRREYIAAIDYDYQIKKEIRVEVKSLT
ncbi:MAG: hypothetical protein ABIA37_00600 [Candidatus Woesearchaeota archaeon]